MEDTGNIVIYESDGGDIKLDVRLEGDTVWLTQEQLSVLFNKSISTINYHINNIFKEGELNKNVVFRKIRITTPHGAIDGMTQQSELYLYNLDVIISVGYRVKSINGTRFRQWATKRLNEYIRKGFTMDDERLKELGGGGYWKELLNRIRDIRASEKVFYRQILDIYATSIDYDPKADISIDFFKRVQNKIHFAVHGHTAAEVIYSRADAEKEFMGLTTFRGNRPHLSDVLIAKNYLSEKELRSLGQLVSGYLDFAERKAEMQEYMTMADWAKHLDSILTINGEPLLLGSGTVSHHQAVTKASEEYKKYQQRTLSDVEQAYLDTIKSLEEKTSK
ncbi:MAG: virulence RhuM family protein [Bacteroidales bacterium]|nr:virulence RhuM family protein [Bacteroidales bacterium]